MEEEKDGADKFMSIDKFITELISYHEQIKQLKASEAHYKDLAGNLQETLKKYQAIVDHLPLKVFLKDKNSSYLFGSESYARFLGIVPQEIVGKTDHDFFPHDMAEQTLSEERRLMEAGQAEEKEERHTREGRIRVDQTTKIPIKNESGGNMGIVGFSLDITGKKEEEEHLEKINQKLAEFLEARNAELAELKEIREKFQWEQAERRRLEEKLKNSEALYSILFENTGTAVAVVEDNRVISRINTEFEKLSGCSRADVEGTKNWGEVIPNGFSKPTGESAGSPSLISPDPGIHVLKFVGGQNEEKTVSMIATPIPETNRILVSLMDISKYKKAREELNRVMKQVMEVMAEMEKGIRNLDG